MRLLWLKSGPLHPLDTGGKLRTFNMLRELSRRHEITFLSLCLPSIDEDARVAANEYSKRQIWVPWTEAQRGGIRFSSELLTNCFSRLPYAIAKYRSAAMAGALASAIAEHDLVVCDFLFPAINLLKLPKWPELPTLLFQHNVESQIWCRHYENARGILRRFYFRCQWRRMQRYERFVTRKFDGVVTVSDEDAGIHRRDFGLTNVLGAVPTGVDIDYFAPVESARPAAAIVFLGSMDWLPNVDAAEWFLTEIWPMIRTSCHDATITFIGRNPPTRLRDWAARDPHVRVTGTVPDVRPYLAQGTMLVVPLRIGGGTRIKIYEGMSSGLPVVSTTIGAEGLPLRPTEHIEIADSSDDFAATCIRLIQQPSQRAALARTGSEYVRTHFGWGAATETFSAYCDAAIKRKSGTST